MNRREFIAKAALAGTSALLPEAGVSEAAGPRQELAVAGLQMLESRDVSANERAIHRAIDQAAAAKTDFLLTPEGGLSGYYAGFDRETVAQAVVRVAAHAKESRLGLLLGTCYKELEHAVSGTREYCYDQVRVYAPSGDYLGAHSKILLCSPVTHPGTGEMKDYVAGSLRAFTWKGLCFGALICNDLWATPGFTTIPNPYLALQLRNLGAQVLFHAVATPGPDLSYRPYHESNQRLWAKALGIPIVTVNLSDGKSPTNCRGGVILPDGERKVLAGEVGEQFFTHTIAIA
jgi:predicted amidohydrolase